MRRNRPYGPRAKGSFDALSCHHRATGCHLCRTVLPCASSQSTLHAHTTHSQVRAHKSVHSAHGARTCTRTPRRAWRAHALIDRYADHYITCKCVGTCTNACTHALPAHACTAYTASPAERVDEVDKAPRIRHAPVEPFCKGRVAHAQAAVGDQADPPFVGQATAVFDIGEAGGVRTA